MGAHSTLDLPVLAPEHDEARTSDVNRRPRFVALSALVGRRFPDVDDPEALVLSGFVLVDGAPISNPRAFVPADASLQVLAPKPLRGTVELAYALVSFALELTGLVAVDLGAAAGGFTQALLDAGVGRVYAVDAGVGQLRGWLRADSRVVNLERTNLAALDGRLVPEPVDVVVIDLSYLAIASALSQLDGLSVAPAALLVALVKPTFELHSGRLADRPEDISAAVAHAKQSMLRNGWEPSGEVASPVAGARGAVEALVLAKRGATSAGTFIF